MGNRTKLSAVTMVLALFRTSGLAASLLTMATFAAAQGFTPQGGSRDQTCNRLEAQLSGIDRASGDPARVEQLRRYEDAIARQQGELDRAVAQSRRLGCESSGFFQLFNPQQSQQCAPLTKQIQDMRGNQAKMQAELQRAQGAGANYERDGQRRAVLAALAQNDCGPQYRQAAVQQPQGRNFFEQLFGGPGSIMAPEQNQDMGSGYRTVCVRTCDGSFFPISFSTSQDRFRDDERTCQRMCPAAEVVLFSYRNPGEDISKAISISGQPYTALPNAFRFKQEYNAACACKRPGESWADAMKHLDDRQTVLERGDIIVTEERAKTMNAPRDAKGRPILAPKGGTPAAGQTATPASATDAAQPSDSPAKPIRSVGPKFLTTQ
jgi:hypothetical protein